MNSHTRTSRVSVLNLSVCPGISHSGISAKNLTMKRDKHKKTQNIYYEDFSIAPAMVFGSKSMIWVLQHKFTPRHKWLDRILPGEDWGISPTRACEDVSCQIKARHTRAYIMQQNQTTVLRLSMAFPEQINSQIDPHKSFRLSPDGDPQISLYLWPVRFLQKFKIYLKLHCSKQERENYLFWDESSL